MHFTSNVGLKYILLFFQVNSTNAKEGRCSPYFHLCAHTRQLARQSKKQPLLSTMHRHILLLPVLRHGYGQTTVLHMHGLAGSFSHSHEHVALVIAPHMTLYLSVFAGCRLWACHCCPAALLGFSLVVNHP